MPVAVVEVAAIIEALIFTIWPATNPVSTNVPPDANVPATLPNAVT